MCSSVLCVSLAFAASATNGWAAAPAQDAPPATSVQVAPDKPPTLIDLAAIRNRQLVDPFLIDRDGFGDLSILGGTLPDATRLAGVEVPSFVDDAVARLDSSDWSTREEAARALFDAVDVDEPIMAILQRGTLAAEQRHRLLAVLVRRLATAARGALGIQMQFINDGRPGVVVMNTLPGMPAEKALRPNDRIMAIDGRPVFDSNRLQSIIMVERPGRQVSLEVERPRRGPDGRELRNDAKEPIVDRVTVELTLGSSDDLDRFDGVGINMQGAIRQRRGRNPMLGPGNNRVGALRQAQVEEAFVRFSPEVETVTVANRRTPPDSVADFDDIDRHPSIRALMVYRTLVAEGAVRVTPALMDSWTRTLIELRQQAEAEGIPDAMREYITAVADRYATLMPR